MPPYGEYQGYSGAGGGYAYPPSGYMTGPPQLPPQSLPLPPQPQAPPQPAAYGPTGAYYAAAPPAPAPAPVPYAAAPPPQPMTPYYPQHQVNQVKKGGILSGLLSKATAPAAQPMPVYAPPPQPAAAAPYSQPQPQQQHGILSGLLSKATSPATQTMPTYDPRPQQQIASPTPPPPPRTSAPLTKAAAPPTASAIKLPLKGENAMESIYAATPEQIRKASEYNEKESQRLLNSLMPGQPGAKKLSKKEMKDITTKAYAHRNEAKRLARKAEMMDAELELEREEEKERKTLERKRRAMEGGGGCHVFPPPARPSSPRSTNGREGREESEDLAAFALCGAFGGDAPGDATYADATSAGQSRRHRGSRANSTAFDTNSIVRPTTSITLNKSLRRPPSSLVHPSKEQRDGPPRTDYQHDKHDDNKRGGGAFGFLRRSKSRDQSEDNNNDKEQPKDDNSNNVLHRTTSTPNAPMRHYDVLDEPETFRRAVTTTSAPMRNQDILGNLHKVEDEMKNLMDQEDSPDKFGGNDDGNGNAKANYAVAPSSMKVISKVDCPRPLPASERMEKDPVIMNLTTMLEEANKQTTYENESDPTMMTVVRPIEMKKKSGSFRKTFSRFSCRHGKKTIAKGHLGADDSDDEEEPRFNEFVDFSFTQNDVVEDEPNKLNKTFFDNSDKNDQHGPSMNGGSKSRSGGLEASASKVSRHMSPLNSHTSVQAAINSLEWKDPALAAVAKTEDISLPAVLAEDGPPLAIQARFEQTDMNGNSKKLVNKDEVFQAVVNGGVKHSRANPTPLDRHRSRKDMTHDDHDLPKMRVSDSFNGFVEKRRSDIIEQRNERKGHELSQMRDFLDTYGEDAYRQVYGPYEQQLGYGLFYDELKKGNESVKRENGDVSMHTVRSGMDQAHRNFLESITEETPVRRRGRSMVRSAARKVKRSLSKGKRKNKHKENSAGAMITPTNSMLPQLSMDQRDINLARTRSSYNVTTSSRGMESSTRKSSEVHSDDAQFHLQLMANSSVHPASTNKVASTGNYKEPPNATANMNYSPESGFNQQQVSGRNHQAQNNTHQMHHPYNQTEAHNAPHMTNLGPRTQQSYSAPQRNASQNYQAAASQANYGNQTNINRHNQRQNRRSVDGLLRRMRSEDTE